MMKMTKKKKNQKKIAQIILRKQSKNSKILEIPCLQHSRWQYNTILSQIKNKSPSSSMGSINFKIEVDSFAVAHLITPLRQLSNKIKNNHILTNLINTTEKAKLLRSNHLIYPLIKLLAYIQIMIHILTLLRSQTIVKLHIYHHRNSKHIHSNQDEASMKLALQACVQLQIILFQLISIMRIIICILSSTTYQDIINYPSMTAIRF